MLVLFPFEAEFYQQHGVPAVHVGHPLVDEVPKLEQAWDLVAWDAKPNRLRLLLLPGSRKSEIVRLLPAMLGALREIAKNREIAASLLLAPGLNRREIEERLQMAPVPVELLSGNPHQAIAEAHLAFVASGTATLEVGLLRTPMVVVYRLAPLTFWLAKWLVRVPHFSLVNLVLGRKVVPELLQEQVSAKQLSGTALELVSNRDQLEAMRRALGELRGRLGSSGASARAAEQVLQVMRS
jgi:lipid-A-disaccharide synthase